MTGAARTGVRRRLDRTDWALLERCSGPTLDVGCGVGRLAAALIAHGVVTLGVDTSRIAVRMAAQRGVTVLERSVFDPLPGEGRWSQLLLADGSIGIGANPVDLLDRCAELVRPGGVILAEFDRHASGVERCLALMDHSTPDGGYGVEPELDCLDCPDCPDREAPWLAEPLPWAVVGEDAVGPIAESVGLVPTETWRTADRGFVVLTRPVAP
ncbi:MAG TPA: class I SAM-dependent methyltransferase [Pseudonocardiaceae bacterium]